MKEKLFLDISVGNTAEFEVLIDQPLLQRFVELSGDSNPLHTDAEYAKTTSFGGVVPHGMIAGAFFSRLVGVYLPGKYALYLSQTLFFKKPMVLGHVVVVSGTVVQKVESAKVLKISTRLSDRESGVILVEGEAMVQLLK